MASPQCIFLCKHPVSASMHSELSYLCLKGKKVSCLYNPVFWDVLKADLVYEEEAVCGKFLNLGPSDGCIHNRAHAGN